MQYSEDKLVYYILPGQLVLHGPVNLASIGKSLEGGSLGSLALLATEFAQSIPCVAAPVDNIGSVEELRHSFRGAAFVGVLNRGDLQLSAVR